VEAKSRWTSEDKSSNIISGMRWLRVDAHTKRFWWAITITHIAPRKYKKNTSSANCAAWKTHTYIFPNHHLCYLLCSSNPFCPTLPSEWARYHAFHLSESKVSIIDQLQSHSKEKEGNGVDGEGKEAYNNPTFQ